MKEVLIPFALVAFVGAAIYLSIAVSKPNEFDGVQKQAESGIALDFTAMNETLRVARFTDLMRTPESCTGKTVRVSGSALYYVDIKGRRHCRILVPDPMGCCGIGVVEYVPAVTNTLPERGMMFELTGTLELPREDTDVPFILTGATVRPWRSLDD